MVGLYGVGGGYLCAMMWWERIWGVRAASLGGGNVGGLLRSARREGKGIFWVGSGATQGMDMLSRLNVGVTRSSTCLLQRV
jgi:hypothetical protein